MKNDEYNGPDKNKIVRPEVSNGLRSLFLAELLEAYSCESAICEAYPDLALKSGSDELSAILTKTLITAREHLPKLEKIFYLVGETVDMEECDGNGIAKFLLMAQQSPKRYKNKLVSDASIIANILKADHLGIAIYGTLCSLSKTLDKSDITSILHEMLLNKKASNEELSEEIEILENQMLIKYYE